MEFPAAGCPDKLVITGGFAKRKALVGFGGCFCNRKRRTSGSLQLFFQFISALFG
jgi:hypothetical protein